MVEKKFIAFSTPNLRRDLYKRLKIYAALNNIKMYEALNDLLEAGLDADEERREEGRKN